VKDAHAYVLEVSRNGNLCQTIRNHHRALLLINPMNRSNNFCKNFLYAHRVAARTLVPRTLVPREREGGRGKARACGPPPGERTGRLCRSWLSGSWG
jgi:hypothetical protein